MKKIGIICSLLLFSQVLVAQTLCKSAFHFKKVNQSVDITAKLPATTNQLYSKNGFTWEAWFKLNAPIENKSLLMSVEDAVVYQDIFFGFGWGSTPNALSFLISDNGGTNYTVYTESLQALTVGTWYHAAAVCDYNNALLKLYLNGNLVSSKAIPAGILNNRLSNNRLIQIANASQKLSGPDADIDEIRFWNVARTQADIQSSMNGCLPLPAAGLVAYFKADEKTGLVANSAVNANFIGSLVNATWAEQVPNATCALVKIDANTIASCRDFNFSAAVNNSTVTPTWQWDLGDGATATTQNITHGYSRTGPETIKLIATDAAGCKDSAMLAVTVLPKSFATINQTICQGQTYSGHAESGVYIDSLTAANGCDSIRTLNLTVNKKTTSTVSQVICQGQTYWGHSTSGSYVDTLVAVNGCDSIRTLNLTVNKKTTSTINQAICQGQTYLGYHLSGTYTDTFSNASGCDSIRILQLTVRPRSMVTLAATVCNGQSYLGHSLTGTYTDTLQTTEGCDSIVTLHLTVLDRLGTLLEKTICQGDSFEGHNMAGIYVDTLHAANGCDSLKTLKLTVYPDSSQVIFKSICEGDSFEGKTSTGIYTDSFKNANGCDSIRVLHLSVSGKPAPLLAANQVLCTGSELTLLPGAFDDYLWQDGSTQNKLIIKHAGTYSVTVTNRCGTAIARTVVTETDCKIVVPNAFSPNGDGINDAWQIPNLSAYSNCKVSVFNRYGTLVFKSEGYRTPWDGRYNSHPLSMGVYYWIIDLNTVLPRLNGSVSIIR